DLGFSRPADPRLFGVWRPAVGLRQPLRGAQRAQAPRPTALLDLLAAGLQRQSTLDHRPGWGELLRGFHSDESVRLRTGCALWTRRVTPGREAVYSVGGARRNVALRRAAAAHSRGGRRFGVRRLAECASGSAHSDFVAVGL